MSFMTAAECETYEACDESISTVCARARRAMNRCAAGLITRSCRPIRYQRGNGLPGRRRALLLAGGEGHGTLSAGHLRGRAGGDVGGEERLEPRGVDVEVRPLRAVGLRERSRPQRLFEP